MKGKYKAKTIQQHPTRAKAGGKQKKGKTLVRLAPTTPAKKKKRGRQGGGKKSTRTRFKQKLGAKRKTKRDSRQKHAGQVWSPKKDTKPKIPLNQKGRVGEPKKKERANRWKSKAKFAKNFAKNITRATKSQSTKH